VTQFTELGLAAPILKALAGEGYTTPTPIQAKAIPAVLAGSDLLGIAQTGTGKTAAFALPILHRLATDRRRAARKGCRILVLTPTRELASQIADSFKTYGRHLRLTVAVVFGGVGHRPQIQALSGGVDVLIATPGRLLDHMAARAVNLQGTEVLVLDEADRMLDMGFIKPIRQIISHLTAKRQTLLFSATMPQEIAALSSTFLRNPVKVAVTPVASTAERVSQRVIHVESQKKRALLAELLSDPGMSRTLVFTRTKRGADRVAKHLDEAGIRVAAIHGNKSQKQREIALEAFRSARIRVLVATDIAARGIDVDGVSHVVNYELPDVAEDYVHRIGRTARAGGLGQRHLPLRYGRTDSAARYRAADPADDHRRGSPRRHGTGVHRRSWRALQGGHAATKLRAPTSCIPPSPAPASAALQATEPGAAGQRLRNSPATLDFYFSSSDGGAPAVIQRACPRGT
jgi:ATP-dependent RNA helicase RhlE